jgi:hypothetical protein
MIHPFLVFVVLHKINGPLNKLKSLVQQAKTERNLQ